jgi:hypothetical protein
MAHEAHRVASLAPSPCLSPVSVLIFPDFCALCMSATKAYLNTLSALSFILPFTLLTTLFPYLATWLIPSLPSDIFGNTTFSVTLPQLPHLML